MTSILVHNFPSPAASFTAVMTKRPEEKIHFASGYDPQDKSAELFSNAMSSFFQSLMVHEVIYLSFWDFKMVLESIGHADMLELLNRKVIKLLPLHSAPVIMRGNTLSFDRLTAVKSSMDDFEEEVGSKRVMNTHDRSKLLQYAANATVEVQSELLKITDDEVDSDLSRGIFSSIGVHSKSLHDIRPEDALKVLRLADTTLALVLQQKLGIDTVIQDAFVSSYLQTKLGALAPRSGDSLSLFANITKLKGIPDLYRLFKSKTITMDDVLRCRDSFAGGLFRRWYESSDYDEARVIQTLLNGASKGSPIWKLVRLVYPEVMSVIHPVLGPLSSAVDSYIVEKIVAGWSPSLFLDDVLKRNVDRHIELREQAELRSDFTKRFGSIGRNDSCPCQSGKKYKHCHLK